MPAPPAGEVYGKPEPLRKEFCPEQIRAGSTCVEQIGLLGSIVIRVLSVEEPAENQFLILRRDPCSEITEIQPRLMVFSL